MGYNTYVVQPTRGPVARGSLRDGPLAASNGLVRVELTLSGEVSLVHVSSGRRWDDCLRLEDGGEAGDGYTHSPPLRDEVFSWRPSTVGVVEDGPLATTFCLEGEFLLPRSLTADRRSRSAERVGGDGAAGRRVGLLRELHRAGGAGDGVLRRADPVPGDPGGGGCEAPAGVHGAGERDVPGGVSAGRGRPAAGQVIVLGVVFIAAVLLPMFGATGLAELELVRAGAQAAADAAALAGASRAVVTERVDATGEVYGYSVSVDPMLGPEAALAEWRADAGLLLGASTSSWDVVLGGQGPPGGPATVEVQASVTFADWPLALVGHASEDTVSVRSVAGTCGVTAWPGSNPPWCAQSVP